MFAGAYFGKRYFPASYFPPTAEQVAWLVATLGGAADVTGVLSAYIQLQPGGASAGGGGGWGGAGYVPQRPTRPRVAREKPSPSMNALAEDDDIMQIIAAFLHLVGHE